MPSPGRPSVAWREDRVAFWAAIRRGAVTEDAAAAAGVSPPVGFRWFRHAGGVNPGLPATVSGRFLSFGEREAFALLRAQGKGVREIARRIGRDPSTISRELGRNGLLVETLVEAGFTVIPINPDLVARRRGPARKKDDVEDARICCLLALDTYIELRALIPHGQIGAELRAIARDDVRAARDERRLGNRLRADLLAVFPAAIEIADGDLSAAVFLKLVERWPCAQALAAVSRDELEASLVPAVTVGRAASPTVSCRRCRGRS
ncbi:helix-turn-helix domain-containing protein [Dactylosporangium sp. NPDC051484]|uniref:helix-turn-helix domain-containing protein n=1 Tax=Dactylosporangium sp. NPDC051484 TaxID=3154942 RepID=UPI00344B0D93